MKVRRINIGEIIREIVKQKGLSNAAFAREIGIKRQNVEKTVFQKHSIDTDLLCTICEVLECNLFNYFIDTEFSTHEQIRTELRATLSVEMGASKKNKIIRFVFGDNDIKILDN